MPNLEVSVNSAFPGLVSDGQQPYRFLYYGTSMRGTFRLGDRLIAVPVTPNAIRLGDVLVYRRVADWQGTRENVVHRVMAITPLGVIMRGDSNPANDIALVREQDIVGRVTCFERDGKSLTVRCGALGRAYGQVLHIRFGVPRAALRCFRQLAIPILRGPYRWLRNKGIVARFWRPSITKIYLLTDYGPIIKYVSGKRTVAEWCLRSNQFIYLARPYDLILLAPDRHDS